MADNPEPTLAELALQCLVVILLLGLVLKLVELS